MATKFKGKVIDQNGDWVRLTTRYVVSGGTMIVLLAAQLSFNQIARILGDRRRSGKAR